MARVLVIEDDQQVREMVVRYLEREGIRAIAAADGKEGLAAVAERGPDLVLLDVRLPDIDGWAILRRLRDESRDRPAVIMLTARSDEPDRMLGFDLGADDYIVKPFSPREVVARVKAVLRRLGAEPREPETLEFPGLKIDVGGRMVWRVAKEVLLTPKEFDLLLFLATHQGRVMKRGDLYDEVWGGEGQGDVHTLDVHMNRLRRKLAGADGMRYLTTVKGIGFRFEVSGGAE